MTFPTPVRQKIDYVENSHTKYVSHPFLNVRFEC